MSFYGRKPGFSAGSHDSAPKSRVSDLKTGLLALEMAAFRPDSGFPRRKAELPRRKIEVLRRKGKLLRRPHPGMNARATMKTKSRLKPTPNAGGEMEPPSGGFSVEA
jgi:hypothetical protein